MSTLISNNQQHHQQNQTMKILIIITTLLASAIVVQAQQQVVVITQSIDEADVRNAVNEALDRRRERQRNQILGNLPTEVSRLKQQIIVCNEQINRAKYWPNYKPSSREPASLEDIETENEARRLGLPPWHFFELKLEAPSQYVLLPLRRS
jgi:hypothetical protein